MSKANGNGLFKYARGKVAPITVEEADRLGIRGLNQADAFAVEAATPEEAASIGKRWSARAKDDNLMVGWRNSGALAVYFVYED